MYVALPEERDDKEEDRGRKGPAQKLRTWKLALQDLLDFNLKVKQARLLPPLAFVPAMTSRYSTFSSIPQSILPSSISLVAPTKTASLGPSNIPGNSISSYERTLTQLPATGTASPSSASAAGSESAGSGGVKPAVVGVAVSVSVGIVLLAVRPPLPVPRGVCTDSGGYLGGTVDLENEEGDEEGV